MTASPSLVVVGAGPAGLSAALAAARAGMRVTLIDEAKVSGGQYFRGRQSSESEGSPSYFEKHVPSAVTRKLDAVVVDVPEPGTLLVWHHGAGVERVTYDRLVIATGAYDRAVALPGWTLPGVLTAGGASTLAKVHGVTAGKRMLVAGSGAFLLSVSDDLSHAGCQVEIVEATPLSTSVRGLSTIAGDPEIMRQALGYLARLTGRGVRRSYGQMVTRIHGGDRVEAATIHKVDRQWRPISGTGRTVEVDGVCLGFGFVPQLELTQALDCKLKYDASAANYFVSVDHAMRTSQGGIYAAGEVTGIAGMRVATAEGELAGIAAAHDSGLLSEVDFDRVAERLGRRLARVRRVADWLKEAYRPRAGLWSLADRDTILCRCEDVTLSDADDALRNNAPTPVALKTATRSGMGLCQGRICTPYLIEWLQAERGYRVPPDERPWRIRPPIRPVPLADWMSASVSQ